jgi:hypothetical protein
MKEVKGEGLLMLPLNCQTDHPHYQAEEWRQRVEG